MLKREAFIWNVSYYTWISVWFLEFEISEGFIELWCCPCYSDWRIIFGFEIQPIWWSWPATWTVLASISKRTFNTWNNSLKSCTLIMLPELPNFCWNIHTIYLTSIAYNIFSSVFNFFPKYFEVIQFRGTRVLNFSPFCWKEVTNNEVWVLPSYAPKK